MVLCYKIIFFKKKTVFFTHGLFFKIIILSLDSSYKSVLIIDKILLIKQIRILICQIVEFSSQLLNIDTNISVK